MIHKPRPDKIIRQSALIEETAKRLDLYPKDIKKILDTYLDVITDHILQTENDGKVTSIKIFPAIQLQVVVRPSTVDSRMQNLTASQTNTIAERLDLTFAMGINFKRTLISLYRAKQNIFDGWYREMQKKKKQEEQRQLDRLRFGEADYSDTSLSEYDVHKHDNKPKRTFGQRYKRKRKNNDET